MLAQGRLFYLNVSVTRRAGFTEAVSVAPSDLPPSTLALTVPIPKEAKAGLFPVFCWQEPAPGIYTFVFAAQVLIRLTRIPKRRRSQIST